MIWFKGACVAAFYTNISTESVTLLLVNCWRTVGKRVRNAWMSLIAGSVILPQCVFVCSLEQKINGGLTQVKHRYVCAYLWFSTNLWLMETFATEVMLRVRVHVWQVFADSAWIIRTCRLNVSVLCDGVNRLDEPSPFYKREEFMQRLALGHVQDAVK